MKGGGRRGRRGGRRQRRREEQQRAARGAAANSAEPDAVPAAAPSHEEAAAAPADAPADRPESAAVDPARDRRVGRAPLSARELVARREAQRTEAAQAPDEGEPAAEPAAEASSEERSGEVAAAEPRRFEADGRPWLARVAGRGVGGTGRVAQATLEAIRFHPADAPDQEPVEVLVPLARLDDLFDEELAELLQRGLRSRERNG